MKILSNSQYNKMLEEIGRLQGLSITLENEAAQASARLLEGELSNAAVVKELNERNSKFKAELERQGKIIASLTAKISRANIKRDKSGRFTREKEQAQN